MHFRYTNEELEEAQKDKNKMLDFIRAIIVERKSDCTNVYSPLSETLQQAEKLIQSMIIK